MVKPKGLTAEILFLCERREIAQFISAYLRFLRQQGYELPPAQLAQCGQLENLPQILVELPERDGFDGLRHIIFLGDATWRLHKRQRELARVEMRSFLHEFKGYNYYLFPYKRDTHHWELGYLEDLLLKQLRPQIFGGLHYLSVRAMAENFVDNAAGLLALQPDLDEQLKYEELIDGEAMTASSLFAGEQAAARKQAVTRDFNRGKSLLHAMLAADDRFAGMSIAEAAQADLFDFTGRRFASLKKLLLATAK